MVDETETGRVRALGGSLEDLRAFCGVVEFGSISAAARLARVRLFRDFIRAELSALGADGLAAQ